MKGWAWTIAALSAATVLLTWPQVVSLGSIMPHQDVLFSIWRLEWIAHALSHRGVRLFDANIFYPATGTLAYSDATLFEGVLAAPFIWAGAAPAVAYNLVLLLGLLTSAAALAALVQHLTGDRAAAIVAALPFAFAPFRFEHYMHLELQWAAWIPLSVLFVHRAVDRRSVRDGVAAGLCVWLQFLSCFYYAVFLAPLLVLLSGLLLATDRGADRRRAVLALAIGGALALALAVPYALPYLANARTVEPRHADEILRYSATWKDYTSAPGTNLLYGWTSSRGDIERRLFPGITVLLLAAAAFAGGRRRLPFVYLAIAAVSVDLSMGLNGLTYRFMSAHVGALSGLRAPARAGILALMALAVLAGLGASRLRGAVRGSRQRAAVTVLVTALLVVECWSGPIRLAAQTTKVPDVYRFLRGVSPTVILELPAPRADRLPGPDPIYEFWSIYHWNRLINGYSGYYPGVYILTLEALEKFPDDESIARLQRLGVHYIVVHRALYKAADYTALLLKLLTRPEIQGAGAFDDWDGEASLFVVRDSAAR